MGLTTMTIDFDKQVQELRPAREISALKEKTTCVDGALIQWESTGEHSKDAVTREEDKETSSAETGAGGRGGFGDSVEDNTLSSDPRVFFRGRGEKSTTYKIPTSSLRFKT